MELDKLKELIKFMNENELCELEIEEEGRRVKLKKFSREQPPIVSSLPESASKQVSSEKVEEREDLIEIKAPMVGTFYHAPAPGAKPFVEVGDEIQPGDVVCIIEAMKLMNEIKAEIGGKIVKVLVENGAPVEFGEPLFLVKPS
ncbi:MAG: acetyl-CoA carboxylase biotin carboxyl carrier protein [Candidatus Omnitrophota bacterium]|nr:acetyl-CoA carboxylase biotin carboxyl carrier protein [Candidatus Omnitrophota bacterium]RKY32422.1 MAG: acetyl-CoA carboxylase biotin carboxyl carrier protein [Candidatus Omnitrophota bacterium]RKY38836.1 MAG: acetyl-CoA carboxylase biotin carboxyl carrier protein [Candidatus Omnitrophota bacterium]RKY46119.1 MAG: acetyl-CoA carboxylase biotin carboxyl carrier protein [Candidatus Omnitrophota bacterium]HDN86187.1 acetyl-CoA carboxylase biotin carboxyl carrier protein [Candidatus Omnitropho